MSYQKIRIPETGERIQIVDGELNVPDNPVITFIEGDGTGPDIWAASQRVFDAAVEKAYGGRRKISWMEIFAGAKANEVYGEQIWLPQESLDALREFLIGIKGPLTTPVGGGIRSINVAIRQRLDLYACVRPVRYFTGVPSPVKRPEEVDMVSSGRTPRISTPALSTRRVRTRSDSSWGFSRSTSRIPTGRSAFPKAAASALSRFPGRGRRGWFRRPSTTRSTGTSRVSPLSTRGTS